MGLYGEYKNGKLLDPNDPVDRAYWHDNEFQIREHVGSNDTLRQASSPDLDPNPNPAADVETPPLPF